jgi:hypothetical protein
VAAHNYVLETNADVSGVGAGEVAVEGSLAYAVIAKEDTVEVQVDFLLLLQEHGLDWTLRI